MTENIEFIPVSKDAELFVPRPKPAKSYIPDWYKSIPSIGKPKFSEKGEIQNNSIKECAPFLDALTHGYIQETWTDIYITHENESINYFYQTKPEILSHRDKQKSFVVGEHFYDIEFVWKEQWLPKLPKGYSVLYTSPLNNFCLPFKSLDAVIDSDNYYHESTGQYPFYMYKNFSGLIPAGTPMYQIIPIKRENWKSFSNTYNEIENKKRNNELRKHYFRAYKNLFWQKKNFS